MGKVHADSVQADPDSLLLRRTLRALRDSSKALAHASDETSFLQEICRIIVEDCGHAMVWVGLAENDPDKSIRPAAYAGFEKGYLESLRLTWEDSERGRGPTGRSIRTGEICMCRNMLTDPAFTPWREEALSLGYASSIVFPLCSAQRAPLGALTLYSRCSDPFTEDESRLLADLADDVSFGISALRLRQAQIEAEAENKRSQRERDLTITFLRMVNLSTNSDELLRVTARFFNTHADCDAVGIRLKKGADYPYCQALGFSEKFLESECSLCAHGGEGEDASLACLCGKVIKGHLKPLGLSFTEHGSFWSNDASALLQFPFDDQDLICGRCMQEGYGSLALLPLYDGPLRMGLLQLNAWRKDAFTPQDVSLWERLADHLAVAVAKAQAEEALRASEERLRLVLQASAMGTFEVDLVTGEGRWNTVAFELLGLKPGALPGIAETLFRFVHPEDVADLRKQWAEALRSGILEAEFRVIRADGALRWLAAKGQFVFRDQAEGKGPDSYGCSVRFMGVNFDVTARRQSEEHTRFQARLLDAVGQAVLSTDLDQRITYWNKSAAALLGWTADEALGRNLVELTRPDTSPAADDELQAMLRRGEPWSRELQLHRKDGTVLPLFTTNAPVFNDMGEVTAVIGVGVDLTERKQSEEVLRFLGQCPAGGPGEGFFQQLARYLAQMLGMDFVRIDRLEEDQLSARTLVVFHNGTFEDNVTYTLKDTPCGDVVGKRICCFPSNVRTLFAKDAVLQELQAESYLGTTLWSSQGKPIGLIAVIGRQPLKDTRQAESVLQMVAVRAAGELERQQVEDAVRVSQEDLNRAQAVAHVGSWRLNVQRNELFWSDENWRIFGVPKGTPLTYEAFLGTIHPDDRAYVHEKWSAALRGEPYNIEHRIIVDGAVKWVRERAELEFDAADTLLGGFGTTQDITARKLAEAVKVRYELIAQYARDSLLLVDLEGNIIEANQAAVQLYGYSREELFRMRLHALRQDDAEIVDLQIQQARDKGLLFEGVHVCKDGSCIPVEVSARGVVVEGKEMLLSVIRDIRQRKETEMSLRRAKEDAEHASQAKSDFLASMSHELRTPLNAIMGFSQVLENEYFGTLTAKQKEYITDIYESGKHLLSLINDILELSKIEAGKMEPRWSSVNVESLLEHSRIFVKEKCFNQDIHLDFEIDDSVKGVIIRADERRFRQVMYNLLSNAAKFTPSGGSIRVWARLLQGDEPALEVSVSDTGIGIAPEHQGCVFEAFYQVHQGALNKTPGTGLGLSLVKQLVAMHGGRVWLTSEGEGRGSRFTFVLPAIDLTHGEPQGGES